MFLPLKKRFWDWKQLQQSSFYLIIQSCWYPCSYLHSFRWIHHIRIDYRAPSCVSIPALATGEQCMLISMMMHRHTAHIQSPSENRVVESQCYHGQINHLIWILANVIGAWWMSTLSQPISVPTLKDALFELWCNISREKVASLTLGDAEIRSVFYIMLKVYLLPPMVLTELLQLLQMDSFFPFTVLEADMQSGAHQCKPAHLGALEVQPVFVLQPPDPLKIPIQQVFRTGWDKRLGKGAI